MRNGPNPRNEKGQVLLAVLLRSFDVFSFNRERETNGSNVFY